MLSFYHCKGKVPAFITVTLIMPPFGVIYHGWLVRDQ